MCDLRLIFRVLSIAPIQLAVGVAFGTPLNIYKIATIFLLVIIIIVDGHIFLISSTSAHQRLTAPSTQSHTHTPAACSAASASNPRPKTRQLVMNKKKIPVCSEHSHRILTHSFRSPTIEIQSKMQLFYSMDFHVYCHLIHIFL